ncbi:hypothetical protein [Streptococcus pluranimalium]|nr:hypothetical protein [Streptococcus pluranimalium]MDY3042422.1 hypothetical protein [Streptococcus pluranimalium]WFM79921.1 hypothetical protein P7F70_00165 [Streptococcus pluranimalium]HEM6117398.1 hypothetical protein [Streptococcus suis]
MTVVDTLPLELTEEEKLFVKHYQEKDYHHFRDIQKYASLFEKLTNV